MLFPVELVSIMNTRNVMLPPDEEGEDVIRLIDFEKATESSPLLDPCWLALWMLRALGDDYSKTSGDWLALPAEAVRAVLYPHTAESNCLKGAFAHAVDHIRSLFAPIVPKAADLDATSRKVLHNLLATTLAASALAKARYEIRDSRDWRGMFWAIVYFRISSMAIGEMGGARDRPRPGICSPEARMRERMGVDQDGDH